MRITCRFIVTPLIVALLASSALFAQELDAAEVWRSFAAKVEAGADLNVKLRNGQSFRATAVDARSDAFVLQPRTRVPVAVQAIAYEDILSITRREKGTSAAKAAAIGVATGAGAFLGLLLMVLATVD